MMFPINDDISNKVYVCRACGKVWVYMPIGLGWMQIKSTKEELLAFKLAGRLETEFECSSECMEVIRTAELVGFAPRK
jgi:hypothetical protein